MIIIHIPFLIGFLILLIILAAFFSGCETGMMSLNRYRLRHLARKGHPRAQRVAKLLERPDRLLGVILLGSTAVNIGASAVATIIAAHFFGDLGVLVATIVLTIIILVFGESAPKTFAALHPLRVAFSCSVILQALLNIFYPIVVVVNAIANGFLSLFGIHVKRRVSEPLTVEELRSIVYEASGKISSNYQQMLLRILDMEQMTVEDIMIPRNEVVGINLEDSWEDIVRQIRACNHEHVPLYRDNLDKVYGILNLRKVFTSMQNNTLDQHEMLKLADPTYFIPEGALASKQLLNFQQENRSFGLVVDEYGVVQGLVSLQDIIEEIIGEFSTDPEDLSRLFKKQKDGSYLISGNISVRELNRMTGWDLPTDGPKTLSGVIIEYLETIPSSGVATKLAGHPMEIIQVSGNRIRQVRVWPKLNMKIEQD